MQEQYSPRDQLEVMIALAADFKESDGLCPAAKRLAALVDNNVDGVERTRLLEHLERCVPCHQEWLAASALARPRPGNILAFVRRSPAIKVIGSLALAAGLLLVIGIRNLTAPSGEVTTMTPATLSFSQGLMNTVYQVTRTPGEAWRDPKTGMGFRWVPGGSFTPCSRPDRLHPDDCREPPDAVRIDMEGFWLAETEVTQGQWIAVMGGNPSHHGACGENCPVDNVSWEEINRFVEHLNGETPGPYRLPSDEEWEYACRFGEKDHGDRDDAKAWQAANSGGKTHPVATKSPNGLGLHDMGGNVAEWSSTRNLRGGSITTPHVRCQDWSFPLMEKTHEGGLRLAKAP